MPAAASVGRSAGLSAVGRVFPLPAAASPSAGLFSPIKKRLAPAGVPLLVLIGISAMPHLKAQPPLP